jgi:predicted acylesterase/phospholipase RssA
MVLDGRRLVDGGMIEVVPVRRAREMAGDSGLVVAVDCNAGGRWPAADSFVAIALRAGLTILRGRTRAELSGADLVIAPSIPERRQQSGPIQTMGRLEGRYRDL